MITLPWNNRTAPNVMIDIIDKCNIKCDACYQRHTGMVKSIAEIEHDLKLAATLRDLHMVTITGGEPTLHPQLLEIVSLVKSMGYLTTMASNGILLNDAFLERLKSAGLDSILFHVDTGQQRPDLPKKAGLVGIRKRLYELVDKAIQIGIDVSFSWTLFDYTEKELDFVINMFLEKSDVSLLFLSKGIKPETIPPFTIEADRVEQKVIRTRNAKATVSMRWIKDYLKKKLNILPFASIPAITTGRQRMTNPAFVTYFIPIVYAGNQVEFIYQVQPNKLDKILMYIPKLLKGHFIHKTTQNARLTSFRVLFNGMSRLRFDLLIKFFRLVGKENRFVRNKTIVYDDGPYVFADGSVAVCEYCPTAILKNDRLVRCCEIYHT